VCPSKAIEIIDDIKEEKRILIHHPDKCIFCGECERNCITEKGIKLTNKFDTSYFEKPESVENKVEHKLVICKNCGTVIGTEKHIRWIYQKLGNFKNAKEPEYKNRSRGKNYSTNSENRYYESNMSCLQTNCFYL